MYRVLIMEYTVMRPCVPLYRGRRPVRRLGCGELESPGQAGSSRFASAGRAPDGHQDCTPATPLGRHGIRVAGGLIGDTPLATPRQNPPPPLPSAHPHGGPENGKTDRWAAGPLLPPQPRQKPPPTQTATSACAAVKKSHLRQKLLNRPASSHRPSFLPPCIPYLPYLPYLPPPCPPFSAIPPTHHFLPKHAPTHPSRTRARQVSSHVLPGSSLVKRPAHAGQPSHNHPPTSPARRHAAIPRLPSLRALLLNLLTRHGPRHGVVSPAQIHLGLLRHLQIRTPAPAATLPGELEVRSPSYLTHPERTGLTRRYSSTLLLHGALLGCCFCSALEEDILTAV